MITAEGQTRCATGVGMGGPWFAFVPTGIEVNMTSMWCLDAEDRLARMKPHPDRKLQSVRGTESVTGYGARVTNLTPASGAGYLS